MKISDSTNVQMPLKTVISLITLVAVGTWAYFGLKNATMEAELESMMHNKVNIEFLREQVTKMQKDVELLKDKVRQNGAPE